MTRMLCRLGVLYYIGTRGKRQDFCILLAALTSGALAVSGGVQSDVDAAASWTSTTMTTSRTPRRINAIRIPHLSKLRALA